MWFEKLTPALQLFFALNALICVSYALYLDTFEKRAEKLAITHKHELPRWIGNLQLPSLATFFIQTLIYLQSKDVRTEHSSLATATFIFGLVITGALQWRVEKNLRLLMGLQKGDVNFQRRALGWVLLASVVYCGILFGVVATAYAAGTYFQLSGISLGALLFTSALLGIGSGMIGVFASAPFVVRKLYSATPIADDRVLQVMVRSFQSLPPHQSPLAYWIEDDQSRAQMALFTGLTFFARFIKPAVFLSRRMVKDLTEAQWQAVIAHEAAHQTRQHLLKRLGLGGLALLGTVFLTSSTLILINLHFPAAIAELFTFIVPWASLLLPIRAITRQMRTQELEADHAAVTDHGADPTALCEALRKIAKMMNMSIEQASLTHPSVIQRIAAIQALAEPNLLNKPSRENQDLAA